MKLGKAKSAVKTLPFVDDGIVYIAMVRTGGKVIKFIAGYKAERKEFVVTDDQPLKAWHKVEKYFENKPAQK